MSTSPQRLAVPAQPRSGPGPTSSAPSLVVKEFSVVGIGASAGGLDICQKLLAAMPAQTGMAFVLVQHLDPTHESMLVDLLASHTAMTVRQAVDGMLIEPEHLYVIPPGAYLAVADGALHLSQPQARHGARLPFDFLLHSLARAYGKRALCVILSGTGADGSDGLTSVKEMGGLVIAQDPDEAGFDGMPRSAIQTGAVDLVLPVARMPDALIKYGRHMALREPRDDVRMPENEPEGDIDSGPDWLPGIVELLRSRTAHDFRFYKPGTLQRRIERRLAMTAIAPDDMKSYTALLDSDPDELERLAMDLLINVTSFFRDPKVFDHLAEHIVPDLVCGRDPSHPIRIWVVGCSTGEEAYSLAMLFREAVTAAKLNVKLNFFASDVDPDAIAHARTGLYPATIEADVSPARLTRFFTREEEGYRVAPELREMVVFAVQDVLTDPPFSRLDMVSCRNVLIYLQPKAQTRVISLFHFALRDGGLLLLGSAERVGNADDRFAILSKPCQVYRHIGNRRAGDLGIPAGAATAFRLGGRSGRGKSGSNQVVLAELCRQLVSDAYAPAAVLVNDKHECLFFSGPTERYLRPASGHPSHDLFAMAHPDLRAKLRAAIQQATQEEGRVVVSGGVIDRGEAALSFNIAAQPVLHEGETLFLVCFIDQPAPEKRGGARVSAKKAGRVAELERELEATRTELQGAIRNLETATDEQKAIDEEALSVSEEFQTTNEELLTSKEELQSLNEELTALNSQLQETLERQRTTSNDLQNVLFSTNVATLFLDTNLNIRFFTPATRALFNIIPGDIGRPLADLRAMASDDALLSEARVVLDKLTPIEREIEVRDGFWNVRRILPYRTQDNRVEGVVITFVDISERKRADAELEAAKRRADQANIAKSRFLAAASHDLRQPLQTLALLQGILSKVVEGAQAQKLLGRLSEALSAMSGMLNALLDINQIEAGTVKVEKVDFPIDDLLDQLRDEFAYHADAQGLGFRVVPCHLTVHSDPRLLEQMLRNLLSNALKYTRTGRILLGCRRHGARLSLEVWDTGVGIPSGELDMIFEEFHQLDNAARDRNRGLGLGLAIVQRLSDLLGHPIHVRSEPGEGSVFSVDVALSAREVDTPALSCRRDADDGPVEGATLTGTILIVEDEPDVRELLEFLLTDQGHRIIVAPDGPAALGLPTSDQGFPDLLLADYNLPNGMTGIEVATKLRKAWHEQIPVIILTGDISTTTLREIAAHDCLPLHKPVKARVLLQDIQQLLLAQLAPDHAVPATGAAGTTPTIFVVDDDRHVRNAISAVLEEEGYRVETFGSCEIYLASRRPGADGCLLLDACLPGMTGLELLQFLAREGHSMPAIMITGSGDVRMAVQAMQAGAIDFIEKPISRDELLAGVRCALEQSQDSAKRSAWSEQAARLIARLTARQRQIMDLVLAGHPNKNIATDLGVSQRTVENHRAAVMKKTGATSLPALARLAVSADSD